MIVNRGGARLVGLAVAVTVVGLVAGGCTFGKSQPTPIVIIVTPVPTRIATATPDLQASPTPAPSAVETPTPIPAPTAPPPAAAVPSTNCTGSADNKAFWGTAATLMSWDVYCPVLPSGWIVADGNYDGTHGGSIKMTWNGPGAAKLEIDEGAFCTSDAATCSPHATVVGPSTFGDQLGSLDTVSDGSFAVYVNPGTATGYTLTGSGMGQDVFVSYAAALLKVARS
jgi:hypothetical protein